MTNDVMEEKLPEKKYLCPDCQTVTRIPAGMIDAQCPGCGILVFRPVGDACYTDTARGRLTFGEYTE